MEPYECASSTSSVPLGSINGSGVPFQFASISRMPEPNGIAIAGFTRFSSRGVCAFGTATLNAGVSESGLGCASATTARGVSIPAKIPLFAYCGQTARQN